MLLKPPRGSLIVPGNPLSQGLVCALLLNEGGLSVAFDASRRGNHGVWTDTPSPQVSGPYGLVQNIAGGATKSYITLPNFASLFVSNATWVTAVCLPSDAPGQQGSWHLGNFGDYAFYPYNNNLIYDGTFRTARVDAFSSAIPDKGKWHQVAVTTDKDTWTFFQDAKVATSVAGQATVSFPTTPLIGISMGANFPIAGKMAFGYLYNRTLKQTELKQLCVNPFAPFDTPVRRSWAGFAPATGVLFNAAFSSGNVAAANTWSGSVSWADPNRALGIAVPMLGPGVSVTSMTYGGATVTRDGTPISTVTSFGSLELWRITGSDPGAPAAGSNTLVVNLSGSLEFAVIGESVTGVHQTVPTEGYNTAQATNGAGATDASVAITSIADNTLIFAAAVASDTSIIANQTSRTNVSGTLGSGADENSNAVITPPGATTMSYTGVGAFATWAMAGFAWRPVAASGGVSAIVERKYPRGILRGVMRGSA